MHTTRLVLPGFLTLFFLVSACDNKREVPAAAIGALSEAAAVDPVAGAASLVDKAPSYEHVINLGLELEKAKRLEEALASYRRATMINPKAPLAWNNMCAVLTELGRFSDAISDCELALRLEPNFQLAKNNLQIAKAKSAEARTSLNVHKSAMLADPDMKPSEFLDRGMEFYVVKEYDSAIEFWQKVKPGTPFYATARNDIATVYILRKKFSQADKALKVAEKLEPANQLFINNRKWLEDEVKQK